MPKPESRDSLLADEFGTFPMQSRNPTNWTLEQPHRRGVRSIPLRETNRTTDISGACTGTTAIFRSSQYVNKPQSLALTTNGIDGAQPHILHGIPASTTVSPQRNAADAALSVSPVRQGTISTRSHRSVNPLNPQYVLPSLPAVSPHSVNGSSSLNNTTALSDATSPSIAATRDVMQIDDIPGTRSKKSYTRSVSRSPLYTDDIPKRYLPVHQSKRDTTLNLVTDDILHPRDSPQRPARGTNPNEPVYKIVTYPEGATDNLYRWSPSHGGPASSSSILVAIGKIDGAEPRKAKPLRQDNPLLSLRTDDVDGAKPGDPYKTKW